MATRSRHECATQDGGRAWIEIGTCEDHVTVTLTSLQGEATDYYLTDSAADRLREDLGRAVRNARIKGDSDEVLDALRVEEAREIHAKDLGMNVGRFQDALTYLRRAGRIVQVAPSVWRREP